MGKNVVRCGDLMPGCDFQAHGETVENVLAQAAAHAKAAHGIDEISDELAEKVKGVIKDA